MKLMGEYKFIQNNEVVATQKNLLTTKGVQQVLRILSSQATKLGETIAVGIGSTAANVADGALEYETSRAKVTVSSPDFTTGKVVFKATLPSDFLGTIYEVGLWSLQNNVNSGNYDSRLLVSFDPNENWPSTADWQTANARVGVSALRLSPTTSTTKNLTLSGVYIDLLGFSDSDQMKFAYWVSGSTCANVKLTFFADASNYYTYTITSPTAGYHIANFSKSNFVKTGSPTWAAITSIDVSATATAGGAVNVDFDGVRMEDTDTINPDYFLVSRAIRLTPIVKNTSAPMDIEYTLSVVVS